MAFLRAFEAAGVKSARDLAAKAGISVTAVTSFIHADRQAEVGTADAIAGVLGLPVTTVWEMRGEVSRWPYKPPAEADLLTTKQRAALHQVIMAMVNPGERKDLAWPAPDSIVVEIQQKAARPGKARKTLGQDEQGI